MTREYNISIGQRLCNACGDCCESVHINLAPFTEEFDAFIDIYCDDGEGTSPFKDVKDAKIFAEAIVKLLKSVDVIVDEHQAETL